MPTRLIRESARTSPTLAKLSAEAERLFWRLTTVADDYGCFDALPMILLSNCFPLFLDRFTPDLVQKWREELVEAGLIGLYQVEERIYGHFITWSKHQRKHKDAKPKFPPPPATRGDSRQVAAEPRSYPISGNRESNSETENRESRGEGEIKEGEEVGSLGSESQEKKLEREELHKANEELLRRRAALGSK